MTGLSYQFVGLDRLFAGYTRIERGLESLHPLWDMFDDEFYAQETQHFANAPWPALTEAYAKRKAKEFPGKPLLRATDALFESLTATGKAGSVRRPRNLSLEIGTRDPKASFHQEGTDRMVARPPLADPNVGRYEAIAGDYLIQTVTGAFS
jgi:hypothetical protein